MSTPTEYQKITTGINGEWTPGTHSTQATSTARPIFARVPVGGRRNLLTYTEDFSNAVWVKDSVTLTSGQAAPPLFSGTSTLIVPTAASGAHRAQQLAPVVLGTNQTFSIIAKANGYNFVRLRQIGSAGATGSTFTTYAFFNLSTGELGNRSGADATIESLGDGWYRCSVTATTTIAGTVFQEVYPIDQDYNLAFNNWTGDGVSGVLFYGAQSEQSATATPYQKVVTQYDITEAGIPSIAYANYDGVDDILPITLPAITGGTVALVGLNGIWIEDNWDYAGGTLDIGPTTIAGLPAGILDVVGGACTVIILNRAFTAAERAGVVAWGKARGAPGVFAVSDTELVTNGTFDADVSGWTPGSNGTFTWESGRALSTVTAGSQGVNAANTFNLADGEIYIASAEYEAVTGNTVLLQFRTGVFLTGATIANFIALVSYNGRQRGVARIGSNYPTAYLNAGLLGNPYPGSVYLDNISVRKLELIP